MHTFLFDPQEHFYYGARSEHANSENHAFPWKPVLNVIKKMQRQFFFEIAKLVPCTNRFIFTPVTMTRHGIVVKVGEPGGCTIGNAENTGNGGNVENVYNERNGSAEGRGIRKWKLTLTSVRAWLAMTRRGQIKTHCRKQ